MFLELFSLATFRNWLDNEIGILIFVSEEEIEEGDSIIFSWSDTVAKIKFQYHLKVMRASKRYEITQLARLSDLPTSISLLIMASRSPIRS